MKTTALTNSVFQNLMMAAVVVAALPVPEVVFAQAAAGGQTLANSVGIVHGGLLNIPNVISGIFYIGGAILIGMGLVKLKMHSENPTQTPLGHGLGRVGAGAGAIALPALGAWLNNTLAIGANPAVSQPLGAIQ
jgi:hypothetical protein